MPVNNDNGHYQMNFGVEVISTLQIYENIKYNIYHIAKITCAVEVIFLSRL